MNSAATDATDALERLAELVGSFDRIDLSHRMTPGMPSWPTHARFEHELLESYTLGQESCHYRLTLDEHSGTHLDAPLHFIADGPAHQAVDDVDLGVAFGRAAAIEAADLGPGGVLDVDRLRTWEAEHGEICAGDAVLIHFGWDARWTSEEFLVDWPGLGKDGSQYLVDKGVRLVGTDALSMDVHDSTEFPAHYTLLGAKVLIAENLNRVGELPPFSYLVALPLPIADGSGSPVRAVALVPHG